MKVRIDIIFANAGVGEFVPFGKVSEKHFDKLLLNRTNHASYHFGQMMLAKPKTP